MKVLAIDPGNMESAFVFYDAGALVRFGILENERMLAKVREFRSYNTDRDLELAVEMVASYGMAVGREVFDTCVWVGRFIEAWRYEPLRDKRPHTLVYRRDVKMHLCGNNAAKDSNIRQALIDRYGPGKDLAIGTKKAPGPLYGVSADVWAALAVAVTYADGAVRGAP